MPASPWSAAVRANVFLATGSQRDGYFRLRTSHPTDLFSALCALDDMPSVFENVVVSGSGSFTYVPATSSVTLAVGTAGDRNIRQSREYVRYLAGKSQMVLVSVDFNGNQQSSKKAGYFDGTLNVDGDGMFFTVHGAGMSLSHRVGGSDVSVVQANWNVDTLDGNGPSGVTLDTTKPQTLVFVFGGMVPAVMRWGFVLNGNIVICHEEFQTNTAATPQMPRPSLPIRWEIEGDSGTMSALDASVQSEGGFDDKGSPAGAPRTTPLSLTGGSAVPLLSIRLKSAFKRGQVRPTSFSILADGSENYHYQLVLRPTLTGATFGSPGLYVEGDTAATNITAGTVVGSGWGEAGKVLDVPLDGIILGADYAGVSDILTLAVGPVGSAATDFYAAINWREFI